MIELRITVDAGPYRAEIGCVTPHPVLLVCGDSGVGKTSVLRGVCGRLPASGVVEIAGRRWPVHRGRVRSPISIGYVPQAIGPFLGQSVAQNLLLVSRRAEEVDGLIEECGLRSVQHRRVDDLSGGQLRRMAIARALACAPELLVLDEPFAGLDPTATAELLAAISRRVGRSCPLIVTSHTQSQALAETFDGRVERALVRGWSAQNES